MERGRAPGNAAECHDGAAWGSRLAALDKDAVAVGLGSSVMVLETSAAAEDNEEEDLDVRVVRELALEENVEDVRVTRLGSDERGVLSAVDVRRRGVVLPLDASGRGWDESRAVRLAPAASRHGEYGWAGLAVDSATDGGDVVVARGLYRSLSFYREGNLVRNVALRSHPTQVAYVGGKDGKGEQRSLVLVAEAGDLVLFDARSRDEVHRERLWESSPIFGLDVSGTRVAVAGLERTMRIYDTRKIAISLCNLPNVSKYETMQVHFARSDPEFLFTSGMDNEIRVHHWAARKRQALFSGLQTDGRVVGIDSLASANVLWSLTTRNRIMRVDSATTLGGELSNLKSRRPNRADEDE